MKILAASLLSLCLASCSARAHRPSTAFGPQPSPTLGPPPPLPDLSPRLADTGRVRVLPVLFVPADGQLANAPGTERLLMQHLQLSREHYRRVLGSTFELEGPVATHRSPRPTSHFTENPGERANSIVSELLRWRGEDRFHADVVFLAIFVGNGPPIAGGGIPFNGAPGSGGGYIEMDIGSLLREDGYPFQSSLVHELGHAFGLPHVDCHGYPLHETESIMSYNPAHRSRGLEQSATPGRFVAEDYFMLALNRRVFPDFVYDARVHGAVDANRVQGCFMGPMGSSVGPLVDQPGVGYELFYDGRRVNGPDAGLYSRRQAEENCAQAATMTSALVTCRYNGQPFTTPTRPSNRAQLR
jgi:hypothetical protein